MRDQAKAKSLWHSIDSYFAYGKGHGRNLLILMGKLGAISGLGWLGIWGIPPVLHGALGIPPFASGLTIGLAWLVGFFFTLWNFPGARMYNENT